MAHSVGGLEISNMPVVLAEGQSTEQWQAVPKHPIGESVLSAKRTSDIS
jgi:hypothetical protein